MRSMTDMGVPATRLNVASTTDPAATSSEVARLRALIAAICNLQQGPASNAGLFCCSRLASGLRCGNRCGDIMVMRTLRLILAALLAAALPLRATADVGTPGLSNPFAAHDMVAAANPLAAPGRVWT